MLKNISNLGATLSSKELKAIKGGVSLSAAPCTGDCNACQPGSGSTGVCQRAVGPGFACHYECFYPGNNDL